MSPDPQKSLPLSQPIRVEGIKLRPGDVTVSAPADALPRIAAALDLASLEALEARYTLSRNGEKVKLEGTIQAKAHQICVVTLESFPVAITVPVKLDFAPEEEARAAARRGDAGDEDKIDIEVRLNEADPPEPILDGVIDLGAVTLEFLALALDPYPRKPGVSFDAAPAGPRLESPFAVLAKLKREQ
ncbi:YceD family protein [Bosea vaviloviae]|uniref:Phosphodiesterase n=1 Tax=Bosea vaviloviae TaxID=1526658 RepID=A0A1D7U3G1_9HYPH|nr:DUF177 domain-containing protein [Bosea vaviloviae]AOO81919.1 hypothetical protein BHK69_16985 [Bosea vaviloviae]